MNHCPVYTRVGGHAYGTTYPGPIGKILMPHLIGLDEGRHLPSASSLCGACGEVCPVKIPIPDLLVRLQQGGVQFSCADDLFRLLELPEDLAALWHPHLIFHWHGDAPLQPVEAPLDLNRAAARELQRLQWPDDRLQRLLRERRRQGFRNLADLQERLCLPASTVESLIGRVCFGTRRAGPSLPPHT